MDGMIKKLVLITVSGMGMAYALYRLYMDGWNKGWIEAAILPHDDDYIVEL